MVFYCPLVAWSSTWKSEPGAFDLRPEGQGRAEKGLDTEKEACLVMDIFSQY